MMSREDLIDYIKITAPFYSEIGFEGYSNDQLLKLKEKIDMAFPESNEKPLLQQIFTFSER